jgi:hypothetical protein
MVDTTDESDNIRLLMVRILVQFQDPSHYEGADATRGDDGFAGVVARGISGVAPSLAGFGISRPGSRTVYLASQAAAASVNPCPTRSSDHTIRLLWLCPGFASRESRHIVFEQRCSPNSARPMRFGARLAPPSSVLASLAGPLKGIATWPRGETRDWRARKMLVALGTKRHSSASCIRMSPL